MAETKVGEMSWLPHNQEMTKPLVFFLCLGFLGLVFVAPQGHSESTRDLKVSEENVREQMLRITKELGTTCTECHNVNNFKSDAKESFKIGSKHIKLVAVMKANGMDGKSGPEANCYMCHRGERRPPSKMPEEKIREQK